MKKCLCRSSVVGCEPRSCASAVAHLGHAQQACMHTFCWNRNNTRPLAMFLFPCSRCCWHKGWLYTNSLAAQGGSNNAESWKQTERKYISVLVYISMSRRAEVAIGCLAVLLSSDWRADCLLGAILPASAVLSPVRLHIMTLSCSNNFIMFSWLPYIIIIK
jgi:hypothetical protein